MDELPAAADDSAHAALELASRRHYGRLLATLIRVTGDFDAAEDALADAFAAAVEQWPREGVPAHPDAWLLTTARRRAIDRIRRSAMATNREDALAAAMPSSTAPVELDGDTVVESDDQLRLIFTCCHPALASDAQVSLTLRTVCGLTTDEIARAFLTTRSTIAQRIVRAKQKIRDARIPYRVPDDSEIAERLAPVLTCVYLVFTEGYAASAGDTLLRRDLSREAIRLGRLLWAFMPERSEVGALLALMLLHDSRRETRTNTHGDLVLLGDQDRARWDRAEIEEGLELVDRVLRAGPVGPYALQAAIAALHAEAMTAEATDWPQILALYDLLRRMSPSPVIELNRIVPLSMVHGAAVALAAVEALADAPELASYHLLPATHAHLLRELGRYDEAARFYRAAIALCGVEQERRFLRGRLEESEATR